MEMFADLTLGLSVALTLQNLFFCFIGVVLGTCVGVLPGISPLGTMAIVLPVTFLLSPVSALIMLAGIYYGAQYGGSTTAILVALPGEASSIVTVLDGHAMAKKGRAGAALAICALASFFAGCVATAVIFLVGPLLGHFARSFGPAEYFSLLVFGLISALVLARGSPLKAVGMVLLGLLLGTVGADLNTGVPRYTFGFLELLDGIEFLAVAMGLFGLSEIILNLEAKQSAVAPERLSSLWPTRQEFREAAPAAVRGTAVGSVLGLLPGGGAILSSFAAYALEKKLSRNPEGFGHGAVAGVAGPESANNAGAQSAFIPLLTLGIPSNPLMALMLGAMMIHGLTPGPQIMTSQPELFWGVIVSMWVGNLMLVIINLPLIGIWVSMLRIPYRMLFPMIVMFSCIGVYSVNNLWFDIVVMAVCGGAGYVLAKLGCEPAPLLLGFILGPLLEENARRALQIGHGRTEIFLSSPISATLLIMSLALLVILILPVVRKRREEIFVE